VKLVRELETLQLMQTTDAEGQSPEKRPRDQRQPPAG